MQASSKLLDFMINTVSGNHRFDLYMSVLIEDLLVFLFLLGSQVKSDSALQSLIW